MADFISVSGPADKDCGHHLLSSRTGNRRSGLQAIAQHCLKSLGLTCPWCPINLYSPEIFMDPTIERKLVKDRNHRAPVDTFRPSLGPAWGINPYLS